MLRAVSGVLGDGSRHARGGGRQRVTEARHVVTRRSVHAYIRHMKARSGGIFRRRRVNITMSLRDNGKRLPAPRPRAAHAERSLRFINTVSYARHDAHIVQAQLMIMSQRRDFMSTEGGCSSSRQRRSPYPRGRLKIERASRCEYMPVALFSDERNGVAAHCSHVVRYRSPVVTIITGARLMKSHHG